LAAAYHNLLLCILIVGEGVHCPPSIILMEAEAALYWRTVCKHLQSEAHVSQKEYIAIFFIYFSLFFYLILVVESVLPNSRNMGTTAIA